MMTVSDREHDNASDAVFAEEGDAARFFFLIVVGLTEDHLKAGGVGSGFNTAYDFRVIRVGEVGDQHPDDARALAFKRTGGVVRMIVEFFRGTEDAGAGFRVVAGVFARKNVGDRTNRESGSGSDIAERNRHGMADSYRYEQYSTPVCGSQEGRG